MPSDTLQPFCKTAWSQSTKSTCQKIPDLSEKNKIFIYTQIKVLDALTCTMLVFGTTDDKSNISSYFFCKFAEFIINGPNNMIYVYFFFLINLVC